MTASRSNPRSRQGARFPKALAAAGLAAVLVGCGGGSSDSAMDTPPVDPGPSMAEMQATKIENAIAASFRAIQMVTPMEGSPVDAADGALAALKMSIDEATELSEEVLGAYRDTYEAHSALLSANKTVLGKYLEGEQEMKDKKQREIDAANKRRRDDEAKMWIAAIEGYAPAAITSSADNADGFAMKIDKKYATDLEIEVEGNTTSITLDNAKGIPISPQSMESPATGQTAKKFAGTPMKSWGAVVTSRGAANDKTQRQTYTDYFYTDDTADTAKSPSPLGSGVVPQATSGDLNIGTAAKFTDNHFGGTRPAGFTTSSPRGVTFLGARGTLTCTTPPCTVDDNGDDTFSFGSAVVFEPSLPDGQDLSDILLTTIMPGSNSEYVAFGYWLTDMGSEDEKEYNITTFTHSAGYPALHGTASDLRGSASYSGGAAGVYVLKQGELGDENPDLFNGEFVAGVNLMAQFNDPTGGTSPKDQWKITGTIDDFRSSTNSSHILSGWELALEADLGARDADTGAVTSASLTLMNATTSGGGAEGQWTALFLGNAGAGTTTQAGAQEALGGLSSTQAPTANADDHPAAIVGEFNGHFSNGHVVGAFGAEKED